MNYTYETMRNNNIIELVDCWQNLLDCADNAETKQNKKLIKNVLIAKDADFYAIFEPKKFLEQNKIFLCESNVRTLRDNAFIKILNKHIDLKIHLGFQEDDDLATGKITKYVSQEHCFVNGKRISSIQGWLQARKQNQFDFDFYYASRSCKNAIQWKLNPPQMKFLFSLDDK